MNRYSCFLNLTIIAILVFSLVHIPFASEEKQQPKEITLAIPNLPEEATPMVLVRIPAGCFVMGSDENEKYHEENEAPPHKVEITHPFYIGKYEVTQAQWEAIMGNNPSTQININLPVNRVNWYDCQEYLEKLNKLEFTKKNEFWKRGSFRLPTEAEHEYACRAGIQTSTYFGEDPSLEAIMEHAWIRDNSNAALNPVGSLNPNPWGLYDMLGNVWEWCYDWYGLYSDEKQIDPTGPENGEEKVFRGPSWMGRREYVRCADRGRFPPDYRRNTGGFRVVWSKEIPWD